MEEVISGHAFRLNLWGKQQQFYQLILEDTREMDSRETGSLGNLVLEKCCDLPKTDLEVLGRTVLPAPWNCRMGKRSILLTIPDYSWPQWTCG
ncbi:uncharacterized protein ACIQIH_012730 isoform 2-T2 [Cyanocitta cristata]